MKNLKRIFALAWLACSVCVAGTPVPAAVHETVARAITLPQAVGDDVQVYACTACPHLRIATNDATVFRIGDVPVSLAAMRLELKRRPNAMVVVHNSADDRVLIDLSISAAS